jgi:hypothetical protein
MSVEGRPGRPCFHMHPRGNPTSAYGNWTWRSWMDLELGVGRPIYDRFDSSGIDGAGVGDYGDGDTMHAVLVAWPCLPYGDQVAGRRISWGAKQSGLRIWFFDH